ncbi:Manganese superoxide dismutase [Arcticibacter svalbardensis MN12-7]|uniref:Superoxide dismutase n=1 Tax=Arcticibacter svalbardensis MN12-7 TaxID=1150600 RepID=R9GMD5_9SPHI|nr:superoxide dismutase [Arcticibacter svalbardensis]EOR93002.1 Manganese superoxide dismutase [Arcticibacter svalbardensis MN12-7]
METLKRRKFIGMAVAAAGALTVSSVGGLSLNAFSAETNDNVYLKPFLFSQNPLPYSYNGLEPSIDALTMEIHYTKHHAAYIKNVNEAIKAENLNYTSAAEFFAHSKGMSPKARNNAGGAWNHNFFWASMTPSSSSRLAEGKLKKGIEGTFGSIDTFKAEFSKAALGQFGSGWAWLVSDKGKLKIVSTPNQDNPLMDNATVKGTPLLAIDVWEHAYYLKYQNKRNDYIAAFWNVVNWKEVEKRLV